MVSYTYRFPSILPAYGSYNNRPSHSASFPSFPSILFLLYFPFPPRLRIFQLARETCISPLFLFSRRPKPRLNPRAPPRPRPLRVGKERTVSMSEFMSSAPLPDRQWSHGERGPTSDRRNSQFGAQEQFHQPPSDTIGRRRQSFSRHRRPLPVSAENPRQSDYFLRPLSDDEDDLTTFGDGERRPSPSGHMANRGNDGQNGRSRSLLLHGLVYSALLCLSSSLVKEGGLQALLQSAISALQANMTKTLDALLTNAFLLQEGLQQPSHERLVNAVANHQSSFTSLKNFKETQSERVGGSGGHLNGLRGGTRLQYDLTKAGVLGQNKNDGNGKQKADDASSAGDDEETVMLKAAVEMFGDLVDDLGPPLKALSTTCTSSLLRMRQSLVQSQRRSDPPAFQQHEFLHFVERALCCVRIPADLWNSIYTENTEVLSNADNEHVFLEHVFLVYFFIFMLPEFAGELVSLVDAMSRIYIQS
ncbi:hypothetical protein B0H17DRAFT_1324389 [Mycena rosella]|uniref:Uncharacterized protein n=1 Tax=Mycena rosella TaxID=1033263 RepID=A0AAD7MBD7_MYCRO|nr:hypothetical protein B0H17DRAFT_1324389 [Mycena rosella]